MLSYYTPTQIALLLSGLIFTAIARADWDPNIRFGEQDRYRLQFTGALQLWLRSTDLNPGTLVDGELQDKELDLSVRRLRLGAALHSHDRFYLRLNTGFNNLNNKSSRNPDWKILDAYGEYRQWPEFEFGAGKSAWRGLSRNTVPSTTTLLTGDLPIVATPTLNVKDEILRTLNVYAKGQIGQVDYRAVYFEPKSVGESPGIEEAPDEGIADFVDDPEGEGGGFSAYVKWQFFEHEPNRSPFAPGTYLGKRKVWNIGLGYEFQNNGARFIEGGEEQFVDLKQWAVDSFFEWPLSSRGGAITLYGAFYDYDFGPNLVRNIAVNNLASGVDPDLGSFNGGGNGYPIVGTGRSSYLQAGYLTPQYAWGALQPFFDIQHADWERLGDDMRAWNIGIHWLIRGQRTKLTLNLQDRPIYFEEPGGIRERERRRMMYLQFQWVL